MTKVKAIKSNGFLIFMCDFSKKCNGITSSECLKQAAKAWRFLSVEQKKFWKKNKQALNFQLAKIKCSPSLPPCCPPKPCRRPKPCCPRKPRCRPKSCCPPKPPCCPKPRKCCPKPEGRSPCKKPRCRAPNPSPPPKRRPCCSKPCCRPCCQPPPCCPKPRCRPKPCCARAKCCPTKPCCQRVGPVTKNAFFNFLRCYRKTHCGLKPQVLVSMAARKWRRMNKCRKRYFRKLACRQQKCPRCCD